MLAVPGLQSIESNLDRGNPELRVIVDRARMYSLGVTIASVASTLKAAVFGEVATSFRDGDDEIDVRVRLGEEGRRGRDALEAVHVKSESGQMLPIGKFTSVVEGFGTARIVRSNQSRVNIITAGIEGNRARALEKSKALMERFAASRGIEARMVGEFDEIRKALPEMIFALILAIVLVYMVLASQFQSFLGPLVIMCSIPLTLLGISGALLIMGKSLNINSGIGIILLSGTVVNNAIVLIDYIGQRIKEGDDIRASVMASCRRRIRPIMMTTLTTILGMLPAGDGPRRGRRAPAAPGRRDDRGPRALDVPHPDIHPGDLLFRYAEARGRGRAMKYFLENRISAYMLFAGCLIFGIIGLVKLPLALMPQVNYPGLTVIVEYPGITPDKIETIITKPIEQIIRTVPGIESIQSVSEEGKSRINVNFHIDTDIKIAALKVREKIGLLRGSFPRAVQEPMVIRYDPSDRPAVIAAVERIPDTKATLTDIREYAERVIKPRLQRIEGVSEIFVAGGLQKEIHVTVDPGKFSSRSLDFDRVFKVLQEGGISLPAGLLAMGGRDYQVRTPERFRSLSEIADTVIHTGRERPHNPRVRFRRCHGLASRSGRHRAP